LSGIQYISLLALAIAVSIVIATLCFQKKQAPGARSLAMLMFIITLWTLGQLMQALSQSLQWMYFYHVLMFIGIVAVPPSVLIFILDRYMLPFMYAFKQRVMLYIFPFLTIIVLITNDRHKLFYASQKVIYIEPISLIQGTFSSWFWIHTTYSYLLLASSIVIAMQQFWVQSKRYRKQTGLILLSILLPIIMNLYYLLSNSQNSYLDLTPITLLGTGILFFISISAFDLFDFSPVTKRLVYNSVDDLILVLDLNNRIIDFNQSFSNLINLPNKAITGRHISTFYETIGVSTEEIKNINQGAKTFKLNRPDQIKYYQIQESFIHNSKNVKLAKLFLIHDITDIENKLIELKNANARLRLSKEVKSRYLSDLSHEIRTPIHGIIGTSQHLSQTTRSINKARSTQSINHSAHHILNTVNSILDYSKLEANKLNILEDSFSFQTFLDQWTRIEEDFDFDKPVILVLPEDKQLFYGDLKHVLQILGLFITGIEEYVFLRPTQIQGSYDQSHLVLAISVPCSQVNSKKIIDMFTYSDHLLISANSRNPIHLALCKHLITLLKGTYRFSEEDYGVLLTIKMPIELSSSEKSPSKSFTTTSLSGLSIAVVDDSTINQMVIKNQLKGMGFNIQYFDSAQALLDVIDHTHFDLLLTDLNMPEMSGFELVNELYRLGHSELPTIAISANEEAGIKNEHASLFVNYISKPFKKDILINVIQETIALSDN